MSEKKGKVSLKLKSKSVVKAGPKIRRRKTVSGASIMINLGYWYGACEAYSNR